MPQLRRVLLVCSLLAAWTVPAIAQEQGGSIQGSVKDASGAVLPGVTIEARSPSVVGASATTTDSRGEYRFPALPPGIYEITAILQGFTTKKTADVQLQLGRLSRSRSRCRSRRWPKRFS